MGTRVSKVDISIAETGIRNRIQEIDMVIYDRHYLYNLINNVLNYVDDRGDSMLSSRCYNADEVALVAQCLFTSLGTMPDAEHVRFVKIFLQNLLTERLCNVDQY